jgi:hypothetical protein
MSRSIGGSEEVYICELSVEVVIVSGEGNLCESLLVVDGGEEGKVVLVEILDVSWLSEWSDWPIEESEVVLLDGERKISFEGGWRYVVEAGGSKMSSVDRCWERIVFAIRSSLNGFRLVVSPEGRGWLYSSTVFLIANVISSLLVYGKQTLSTQLPL